MKKIFYIFLATFLTCLHTQAQVIYGVNNYTQYHIGTLPIIISAPHGGQVTPAGIPDRTCNSPTFDLDGGTIALARQIDTALFNLTGCRPHVIICNLRRTKVDCNRNLADGACGNIDAENAWNDFHDFIDTAQLISQNQYGNKAIYIDLHGHGKQPYRLELGYGLGGGAYDFNDSTLNTATYLAQSSIENLANTNISGSTHAQLLRGPFALGTLFVNAGFPAVPSQQFPTTGGFPYFRGGYNTYNYTCIAPGSNFNGLQIECDSAVRNNYTNRKKFGDSSANVLVQYLQIHRNMNLTINCGLSATLPINLINFSAKSIEEYSKYRVKLNWQTASETNNDYFTIERSLNGIDWKFIKKINGAINSNSLQNYEYYDKFPLFGVSYYRLKQTDIDGQFTYSQVRSVNITSSQNYKIAISPNPVNDYINIFTQNINGNYQIVISDIFGKIVLEKYNQNYFDVSSLKSGMYVIKLIDQNRKSYITKMLKR